DSFAELEAALSSQTQAEDSQPPDSMGISEQSLCADAQPREPFDPLRPMASAIPVKAVAERSKFFASLVVDNLLCSAISRDEAHRKSTCAFANAFASLLKQDLAMGVVPVFYAGCPFDLLTSLRQAAFLIDVGSGNAQEDYADRHAKFDQFCTTAKGGSDHGIQKSAPASLGTAERRSQQMIYATGTHEATLKIFNNLKPIDTVFKKRPWEQMVAFVENYRVWKSTSNKTTGNAFQTPLAFARAASHLKPGAHALMGEKKYTKPLDPFVTSLETATKQFPEQPLLQTALGSTKQLKMEKNTAHHSTRIEAGCAALQGVKVTTGAKSMLLNTIVGASGWMVEHFNGEKEDASLSPLAYATLKAAELLHMGTPNVQKPPNEIRLLGLLLQDMQAVADLQADLVKRGPMQGRGSERDLAKEEHNCGRHNIAKYNALVQGAVKTVETLSKASNFQGVAERFAKYRKDRLSYSENLADAVTFAANKIEDSGLRAKQADLEKVAGGLLDGKHWSEHLYDNATTMDELAQANPLATFQAKKDKDLK
ncbi:unnamed protein product, partial [Prorocentrum cordatum]